MKKLDFKALRSAIYRTGFEFIIWQVIMHAFPVFSLDSPPDKYTLPVGTIEFSSIYSTAKDMTL